MRRRIVGCAVVFACVLLTTASGAAAPAAEKSGGAPKTEESKEPKDNADPSWAHPLDVIELFFPTLEEERPGDRTASKRNKGAAPGGPTATKEQVEDDERLLRIQKRAMALGYTIDTLVALVPDAIDSRVAGSFDQAVGAVQRAAAEQGWLLDRHYLPWTETKRNENKERTVITVNVSSPSERHSEALGYLGITTESQAKAEAKQARSPEQEPDAPKPSSLTRKHETNPGVLLFRRDASCPPAILAVFLVGETQTWGAQRKPLRRALHWATFLKPSGISLHILGPWFSGTADSIVRELEARPEADRGSTVDIETGSASAGALDDLRFGGSKLVRWALKDRVLLDRAREVLNDLGIAPEQRALIVENDSEYGQNFKSDAQRIASLVLPVYGRLSGVRSEWSPPEQAAAASFTSVRDLKRLSRLTLVDRGNPSDLLPQVAPFSNAVVGVALESIVERLSRARTRYVGIAMTDVRDRIFLSEVLHRQLPDLTFFLFESHALYLHPDLEHTMNGALVFSSHGLEGEDPDDSGSGLLRVRQFTSDAERGTYLAALALLGRKSKRDFPTTPIASVILGGHQFYLSDLEDARAGSEEKRNTQLKRRIGVRVASGFVLIGLGLLCVASIAGLKGWWDERERLGIIPQGDAAATQPRHIVPTLLFVITLLALFLGTLYVTFRGPLSIAPFGAHLFSILAIMFAAVATLLFFMMKHAAVETLWAPPLSVLPLLPSMAIGLLVATPLTVALLFNDSKKLISAYETEWVGQVLAACLILVISRVAFSASWYQRRWNQLRDFLREEEWRGLDKDDFAVLRERVGWSPMDALGFRRSRFSVLNESVHALEAWRSTVGPSDLDDEAQTARDLRRDRLAAASADDHTLALNKKRALTTLFLDLDEAAVSGKAAKTSEELWREAGYRRLRACRTLLIARSIFEELRGRLFETLVLMLLVIAGVALYPFSPKHLCVLILTFAALGVCAVVVRSLREMERNTILSWASGTTPWKVEWTSDYVGRAVTYGLTPLLALIATQIPGIAEAISPVLDALTRVTR